MTDTFRPRLAPNSGMPVEFAPSLLKAKFGEGYEASATLGINADLRECSPAWSNLRKEDADYIIEFLAARKGVVHFLWKPNGESVTKRYKCEKFTYKWKRGRYCDIDAQFRQMGM